MKLGIGRFRELVAGQFVTFASKGQLRRSADLPSAHVNDIQAGRT